MYIYIYIYRMTAGRAELVGAHDLARGASLSEEEVYR